MCSVQGVRLGLDLLQLSNQPSFRVTFNTIHAWASVNHCHIHGWYMDHEKAADNISISPTPIKTFSSGLKVSRSCPKRSWNTAFIWDNLGEGTLACQQVGQFLQHMQNLEIPHNWIMLYGDQEQLDSFKLLPRIIVFPRKSAKGLQPHPSFNVATAELSGHCLYNVREEWEKATFKSALNHIQEAAQAYNSVHSVDEQ